MTSQPGKQTIAIHIAQYLTKYRQPGKEICSGNRIEQEKYCSSKIMQKTRQ